MRIFLLSSLFLLLSLSFFLPVDAQDCTTQFGYSPCLVNTFTDTEGHQFEDAIEYVRERSYVSGYTDGRFAPDRTINRAEFTKILVEALDLPQVPSLRETCFSDVSVDQWFAPYVCYAKDEALLAGYPDGEFKAENMVNFAEASKIMLNAFDIPVRISGAGEMWFASYVEALADRSAIPGTIKSSSHQLTRAELSEMIMRLQQDLRSEPSLEACDLVESLCSTQVNFTDIDFHPKAESIRFLAGRGVIDGYSDGSFRPWEAINRAEMLKLLLGAKASSVGNTRNCFSDVNTEWFAPYVCFAEDQKIVGGYPDGSFRPGDNVTMVEALKMALEAYNVSIPSTNGEWFESYIRFAHDNNLFSRYSYVPGKLMNRGDLAWMIHQLSLDDQRLRFFTGVRDSRSAGCGLAAPGVVPTSSIIDGIRQTYITDVPSNYDPNTPIALTFAWHGRTNSNSRVRSYYKVYEASAGQTIMVYPAGVGPWNVQRDVVLFDQLLAEFSQNYCVDMDRIYVIGHSLGAWFTNSLACVRGDVIRASGSLGGGTTQTDCAGPVAAITKHNPADRLSSFADGLRARDQHLAQNACRAATVAYQSPNKANCVEYTECAPDLPVVWCPHTEDYSWGDYYPHGWPRWTGEEIWDFFEEYAS